MNIEYLFRKKTQLTMQDLSNLLYTKDNICFRYDQENVKEQVIVATCLNNVNF